MFNTGLMKQLTRRYVYHTTYKDILAWAKKHNIKSPNRKENFPYYLEEYIKQHRWYKMLIIDCNTKILTGSATAGQIKRLGLIQASIENKEAE